MQRKLIVGLSLSLLAPVIYVLWLGPFFIKPEVDQLTYILIGFGVLWFLALGILVYTKLVEKRPLASIGWQALSWKSILAAIGLGILLSLLVPVLSLLISLIVKPTDAGSITQVASSFPWWIILLSVITAGVTEEILFRGYALERLLEATGNKWLSAILSLISFICIHASGWNLAHIVGVVLPLGIILTWLYLWRRNLWFVIIVHTVIDLPLVLISLGS